ncbi:hypothetical protein F511_46925 [Dorcoceras hygrometricum]|uniref:Uncharacterized protein n=1 Tax=Dorcoceras hygrometricum TaxID=472368 RepID=A0A2Z6ZTD2_9LAMI|nr:hypothetical protein F511_46925 [Dorcoceras hygrometricum]
MTPEIRRTAAAATIARGTRPRAAAPSAAHVAPSVAQPARKIGGQRPASEWPMGATSRGHRANGRPTSGQRAQHRAAIARPAADLQARSGAKQPAIIRNIIARSAASELLSHAHMRVAMMRRRRHARRRRGRCNVDFVSFRF